MPNPQPSTNPAPFGASADVTSSRFNRQTTITSGSNGLALPQATINVVTTSGFTSSGILIVALAGGLWTSVFYTGKTSTTFTGCTRGSGTLQTGLAVLQGYQAGSTRRMVSISVDCDVSASGDSVTYQGLASAAGNIIVQAWVGIATWQITGHYAGYYHMSFTTDPYGYYGLYLWSETGMAASAVETWIEVDG